MKDFLKEIIRTVYSDEMDMTIIVGEYYDYDEELVFVEVLGIYPGEPNDFDTEENKGELRLIY